ETFEASASDAAAFGLRVYGVAVAGFPPEHVRDWWQRFGAGVPVELLATPVQLARLRAGEAFFAQPRARAYRGEQFGIATELWVPLRAGGHLIGAMALDYGDNPDTDEPLERRLTAQDRALAEAVGKLVALVIERERLLREREEARASELALRQANERLDTFISLASHELRTPLTSIMANAQIAQRRAQRIAQDTRARGDDNVADIEKLAHLLERTYVAAERQNRLVADLLDVSRVHAGKLELRLMPVDLGSVVADAVEEQRLAHPERVILLQTPKEPVTVTADAERIHQVVANYLTNALKYAPTNQPIAVTLSRESNDARVEVRDRGPGIPREEHERIWERFYRVPGATHLSGSGIGLGLGLYICREIVERHGGAVGVESAPGNGSTFFFTLPRAR
ncbi:MAG TPA: ATP-binding protein, partial [Dehalococcoidia bacterium]|nr:ATP-binding protein [Dehalococcoidia bacterium]